MDDQTTEATTTVEEDGLRVEKSFTDDAFPVPAVVFELSSRREEPVRARLVDQIPDSFPMDCVGFHPEYESEHWTAYKDHRVEFERVLEPGESVETVFGIRDDDPELDAFLGDPTVEHVAVDEEIEDVLGVDETDAVREALSGDRATLPGMEDTGAGSATDRPSDAPGLTADSRPEPRVLDAGTTAAVTRHDEPVDSSVSEIPDEAADAADDEADPETTTPTSGIAAALADEIRSGDVDEADLELLREELDVGVPRSVDVRIGRLQSSVADIEAYADALAEFIDDDGTAREILDGIDSRVADVESAVDAIDTRVAAGDRAHAELAGEVKAIEADTEATREAVDGLGDDMDALHEKTDGVDDRLDRFDEEFDDIWEELAAVDTRLTDIEERLGDDIADVDAELAEITDHLEELEAFRNRVNEAFGP
jgi:archaellum component FlaC